MTLLFTLNLESESVGLYSSQLNSFRSETGFSGGPEKFCVSPRQADENVTKISGTAFGQSSTGSWWARDQDIGHGFWAILNEQCSLELYEIGLLLTCTYVIAKIGRTRVETKPAEEFGKDVGVWKMSPFTWWKCFPPKEVERRQNVDGTVKTFRDTEGCFRKEPRFQMGRLCPAMRYERSICVSTCSEHKSVSIFKMASIVCKSREKVTLLCTLNLESESVGLYSSQLNSIRSDTCFYGGHEKFCVSTREADEHVTKISATAFRQSSTKGAVWNYTGFDNRWTLHFLSRS